MWKQGAVLGCERHSVLIIAAPYIHARASICVKQTSSAALNFPIRSSHLTADIMVTYGLPGAPSASWWEWKYGPEVHQQSWVAWKKERKKEIMKEATSARGLEKLLVSCTCFQAPARGNLKRKTRILAVSLATFLSFLRHCRLMSLPGYLESKRFAHFFFRSNPPAGSLPGDDPLKCFSSLPPPTPSLHKKKLQQLKSKSGVRPRSARLPDMKMLAPFGKMATPCCLTKTVNGQD